MVGGREKVGVRVVCMLGFVCEIKIICYTADCNVEALKCKEGRREALAS